MTVTDGLANLLAGEGEKIIEGPAKANPLVVCQGGNDLRQLFRDRYFPAKPAKVDHLPHR